MEMKTKILRPREVARKIGVGDSTFWRWLNDPDFAMPQGFRLGRARCWKEEDIEKWIKKMERKGAVERRGPGRPRKEVRS